MIRSRGCGVLLGLGLVSGAAAVSAAPTGGRVRLSLEGELFGYEKVSVDDSVSSSHVSGGLAPSLGVGIGGGVGNNVLLGARVGVATTSNSVGGSSSSTSATQFTMLAIPEYVFDGDVARPFIGAAVGYSLVNTDAGAGTVSSGFGLLGASFGAHCFAADSVSIDPSASVFYEGGSVSSGDTSHGASGFAVILGVALSGWFGHVAKPKSEEESAGIQAPAAAQPAVVASAAPEANWEDADELTAVVKLTGASRLRFRIEPAESDAIELVIIVDHDNPQLASCNELVAKTAKKDVKFGPFTVSRVGGGAFRPMVALTTKTTILNSKALVAKDVNVKLEGCGESWEITAEQTEELRTFVKHARAAVQQNHPPAEGAAPAAEPAPEPPQGDEAP